MLIFPSTPFYDRFWIILKLISPFNNWSTITGYLVMWVVLIFLSYLYIKFLKLLSKFVRQTLAITIIYIFVVKYTYVIPILVWTYTVKLIGHDIIFIQSKHESAYITLYISWLFTLLAYTIVPVIYVMACNAEKIIKSPNNDCKLIIDEAIEQIRAGEPISKICPRCKGNLTVEKISRSYTNEPSGVQIKCSCGECNHAHFEPKNP